MTLATLGTYFAEAGFMGIVFVCTGVVGRILWDIRKER